MKSQSPPKHIPRPLWSIFEPVARADSLVDFDAKKGFVLTYNDVTFLCFGDRFRDYMVNYISRWKYYDDNDDATMIYSLLTELLQCSKPGSWPFLPGIHGNNLILGLGHLNNGLNTFQGLIVPLNTR